MKKAIVFLSILFLASCQQEKIGFVDNNVLLENYQERKDIEARYQIKSESYAKKRDSITQAFQLEAQTLQTKTQGMSQKKAQEEYAILQQKGQFIGQQLQQEEQQMQALGQTEMDSLVNKVKNEIETYGKANGYAYILGKGEGGSVLYGDETKDLTQEILKLLNEKYSK
ncbi:MAG: OmpH family outer membrane protein [Eudoraea sp.]|nr:OmpH family outer membrane protein [Eudoraea sp.]